MSTFDDMVNQLFGGGGGNPAAAPPAAPTPPYTPGVAPPAAPYTPGAPMSITYSAPGPVGEQYARSQDVLNAQQGDINATSAYYDARGTLIPSMEAGYKAKEADNIANAAYLAEQTRALEAERAETAGIIAAKGDVKNIQSVGLAQRERDQYAYRYNLAGLPTPVEITLPEGHTGPLPAGMQARLRTLAEILEDKAKDAGAMRRFNVEAASIHAATTGLAVTAAEIATGRVRLSIEEVELAMNRAGLMVNQANLNLNRAQQGPPGTTLDVESNRWVTPAEERELRIQRGSSGGADRTGSDLSPLPLDSLISYAAADVLGSDWEAKVRAELARRAAANPSLGYTPGFIDIIVAAIRARQGEEEESLLGPGTSVGGSVAPAAPPPSVPVPTTRGGLGPSGFR